MGRRQDAKHTRPLRQARQRSTSASSFGTSSLLLLLALSGLLGSVIYYYYGQPSSTPDGLAAQVEAAYKLIELPGKGKGLVATRDIEQGTLLIREKPLFVIPKAVSGSPHELISRVVGNLTASQRRAFLELSYVKAPPSPTNDDIALAILQTNGVSAGPGRVGLFPHMARLNHGCGRSFNTVYSWREKEGVLVVNALRPIRQGEELLTTYRDTKKSRDERRAELLEYYGFHCNCSTCSLPLELSALSDKRLVGMSQLWQQLSTWGKGQIDGQAAIGIVQAIWDLSEEEGYWSERGRLAADATWVAAAHTDENATAQWARLAARWFSYELGKDSEFVSMMLTVAKNPRVHSVWGTRARLDVGGPHNRFTT